MAAAFRQSYRYLQRQAHEQPVIFFSVVIGLIGPAMLITVPPIRKSLGYRPSEPIPTSYPAGLGDQYKGTRMHEVYTERYWWHRLRSFVLVA